MITAKVELTQPLKQQRQFAASTGSGHTFLLDDAAGGTGPKPIELIAAGLAGCTAFDVVTILRQKYHQKVTGYEVPVEADQASRGRPYRSASGADGSFRYRRPWQHEAADVFRWANRPAGSNQPSTNDN